MGFIKHNDCTVIHAIEVGEKGVRRLCNGCTWKGPWRSDGPTLQSDLAADTAGHLATQGV